MAQRKRSPKRGTIDFAAIIDAVPSLAERDVILRETGFQRAGGTVRRRRDGSFTVRLVWRRREGCLSSSFVYTMHGGALA